MKKKIILALVVLFGLCYTTAMAGETLNLVIMASKDPKKEGPKYEALSQYIVANTDKIDKIQLRIAKDYPHAVKLFQAGDVDGMFAGSFVAAIFLKKEVAKPVVRPVLKNGVSTYRALVVAKEGTKPFDGIADFKGKKVAYCALASSGEVFARTLLGEGEKPESYYTPIIAKSHQIALNAVQSGAADYAVAKNLVWNPEKYPGLAVVGGDSAENPNMTLILTNATYDKLGEELRKALLKLEYSISDQAKTVKSIFGIRGFVNTYVDSFVHTFENLKKAHIDAKKFDFKF